MAKKEKKGKKSQESGGAADTLRDAVERTFQAGAGGAGVAQKRAAELFDDLTTAMGRLREAVDERRVLETLEQIRDEVQGLAGRVAALERKDVGNAAGAAATTATSAARRATGGGTTTRSGSTARKASTARTTATARKSTAARTKTSGTGGRKTGTTRSGTTATKRAQSKTTGTTSPRKSTSTSTRKTTPARKPPSSGSSSSGSSS